MTLSILLIVERIWFRGCIEANNGVANFFCNEKFAKGVDNFLYDPLRIIISW